MKKLTIKSILFFAFLVIIFIFVLPSFNIKIAGKKISFPEINFRMLGLNATFPSLKQGQGLYSSTKYLAEVIFPEDVTDQSKKVEAMYTIAGQIKDRMNYANIFDINAYSQISDGKYYIAFEIPNNYPNSRQYVEWLTNKGDLQFFKFPETDETGASVEDITTYDIRAFQFNTIQNSRNIFIDIGTDSSGVMQRRNISLPHLVITFDSNAIQLFGGAISPLDANSYSNGIAAVQMYIGDQGFALYAHESNENAIRALPTGNGQIDTAKDVENFLKIISSYFQDKKDLEYSLTISETSEMIAPSFRSENSLFILISGLIGLALCVLYVFRRLGSTKTLVFVTTIYTTFGLTIIFAKLMQLNLSIGFLIGFIFILNLALIGIYDLLQERVEPHRIKNQTIIALVILVSTIIVLVMERKIGIIADMLPLISAYIVAYTASINLILKRLATKYKLDK